MDFTIRDIEKIQKVISENNLTVDDVVNMIKWFVVYKKIEEQQISYMESFLPFTDAENVEQINFMDFLAKNDEEGEHTLYEYDGHGNVRIEKADEKDSLTQ